MKTFTLSVLDRVVILSILPAEGNMVTLLALRQLKESVVFSEFENSKLDVKIEDGNLFWNKEKEENKDVEVSDTMLTVIQNALKKMDAEGKLTEQMIDTYQKFIEPVA